jgi:thiol:disulfide interchange protein DsbD
LTVANRGSGYMSEKEFLGFLEKSKSGEAISEGMTVRTGFWGVLLTMGLILVGGVALNLTPCILPMIPINLAIIGAGAQAGSKKRGFALGATYAAGMAIAYGVLGVVVVLTGSKFGTLNSSPWFNLAIASVFLFLALAMFDIVNVDLSRFQKSSSGESSGSKSKFIVAYTMGTVAALLAGACVAPVVISVLLQATTLHAKGIAVGLLLPFLLGLGMGLPWPFAGAGLSFLPKPGKWMMRVKYGFGVMIVLFAAYYGHLAFGLFRSSSDMVAQARNDRRGNPGWKFLADGTRQSVASRQSRRSPGVHRFLRELVQELFGDGTLHVCRREGEGATRGLSRSALPSRTSE